MADLTKRVQQLEAEVTRAVRAYGQRIPELAHLSDQQLTEQLRILRAGLAALSAQRQGEVLTDEEVAAVKKMMELTESSRKPEKPPTPKLRPFVSIG